MTLKAPSPIQSETDRNRIVMIHDQIEAKWREAGRNVARNPEVYSPKRYPHAMRDVRAGIKTQQQIKDSA